MVAHQFRRVHRRLPSFARPMVKLRQILWLPLLIALLIAALYFAAIAWLESSGGREAIEKQLSVAAGMPVRLAGDFDLALLPAPGARGTELLISDPSGMVIAGSRTFRVDLALEPLLRRQFRVDRLQLEWLTLGAAGSTQFAIPSVAISGFEPGREAALAVELGWFGTIDGSFTWRPADAEVSLDLAWNTEGRDPIGLGGVVAYFADHAAFRDLDAMIGGQHLVGNGCVLVAGRPVLNLDLAAGILDLDALAAAMPGGDGGGAMLPLAINLRLVADEMVRGELRATGSVLVIGDPPDCP